jgi:hypothetical protein
MQKIIHYIRDYYLRFAVSVMMLLPKLSFADDDDPFPSIDTGKDGDIVKTAGSHMETALKYTLIGGGGILIIICLAVIIHRLREDNREKDHGNLVITFILLALGITLGFILIGIGWKAFSSQPT